MPIQPLVFLEQTALTPVVKASRVSAGRPEEYLGQSGGEKRGDGNRRGKHLGGAHLSPEPPLACIMLSLSLSLVSSLPFVASKLPTKRGKELLLWGTWTSDMNLFRPI